MQELEKDNKDILFVRGDFDVLEVRKTKEKKTRKFN